MSIAERPALAMDLLFSPRGIEAVQTTVPDAAVSALRWLTHLGDGALLAAVAVLFYWWDRDGRRRGASLLGIGLGGLALSVGLKGLFARPRPEGIAVIAEVGYSFPSAHALGATVTWGALAVLLNVGTRRLRYALAGTVIVVVSLSRVVLGVHYPGDVLAGLGLGLVYLWIAFRFVGVKPARLFALALGIAAVGAVVGGGYRAPIAVGGTVGAAIGWRMVGSVHVSPSSPSVTAVGIGGISAGTATAMIAPVPTPSAVEAVGYGLLATAAVAAPLVAARLDDVLRKRRG